MWKSKKLTALGILATLSLAAFLIENAFPPIFPFAPGAKLGIANVFIMLTVVIYGIKEGAIVAFVKLILGGLFTGNVFSLGYSLCGLILSFVVFAIFSKIKFQKFTMVSLSVCSALFFNIGQLAFSSFVLSGHIWYYLPIMLAASVIFGLITGLASNLIIKKFF